ncbi:urease accessory protein UreH domain-containing protein [Paracraurococcus lichenis]|uniref:Sulfite exporter TauE/SafE family protein n=1 Tax=Paracraurococcus lichenis TaxID=3064888 RepID=A0ABT9E562_9PROT|nr:sulfite exporter TauE/SafE family protein [Paracraurococcus sp. LOR1-02]MDO9711296.1 sulfite exporter TauE/SafE family protein [Paracraurococcus sp. LOR1-02]
MLADCLHDLAALGPGGLPALLGTLFLAGLAGGVTHCATMCAPFVLAQAATGLGAGGGRLRRLAGAALVPYQAGRMLGYGALGALAGGAAGAVSHLGGLRWLLAGLLALAALVMLGQASRRFGAALPRLGLPAPRLPAAIERRIGALLAAPTGWRGLLLGLLLSALPCGLLYGALAGAAASGSALAGALAMMAFVLGTVPALTGVALLGRLFGRRQGPRLRLAGGALFALNAVVLLVMAARNLG